MITFEPRPTSGATTGNPASITLDYVLTGIFARNVAFAYSVAATPLIVDGLYRQDVKLDPVGFKLWNVSVPYGPLVGKAPEAYDMKWAWDTTGGTKKITQALEHKASHAAPGVTAPNHHGAIGVTPEGDVEGCEIVWPQFKWTETWQLPAAAATFAYSDLIWAMTGKVNASSFRGKPPKSVRFDGAPGSGSIKDSNLVEVTFNFSRGIPVVSASVGSITGIEADPWDYVWIEYERQEDDTAKRGATRPIAVHVERVTETADFSLFGIGTT